MGTDCISNERASVMSKPQEIEPELLTKSDLAKLIQVSSRQVENLVKAGRLPQPLRLGSHPRWSRAALMDCINKLAGGNGSSEVGQ